LEIYFGEGGVWKLSGPLPFSHFLTFWIFHFYPQFLLILFSPAYSFLFFRISAVQGGELEFQGELEYSNTGIFWNILVTYTGLEITY